MILGLEHCVTTKSDGNQEVEWVANHDMNSDSVVSVFLWRSDNIAMPASDTALSARSCSIPIAYMAKSPQLATLANTTCRLMVGCSQPHHDCSI